jgi:hypothetical protein
MISKHAFEKENSAFKRSLFYICKLELSKLINYGKRSRKKYQEQGFAFQIVKAKKYEDSGREKGSSGAFESFGCKNE